MLRRLFRCIVAAFLVLSLSLPFAAGQEPSIERGVRGDATDSSEKSGPSFAFPYALLLIYTLLVMTIVCMPSRKA